MFCHMCKQPVITWGRVWKVGRMCQHLSAPTLHRLAHRDLDEVLHCPGANDTMVQQFWLFAVNCWPHLILQECAAILAIDHHINWHGMVKPKYISAEECDVHDFQSTLTALCIVLPWWHLGAPFNIVISTEGRMNESMTCQPLKCGWGKHCLSFCNAAGGWWQEKLTWLFGQLSMCWIHFAQTLHSTGCWWRLIEHLLESYWLL